MSYCKPFYKNSGTYGFHAHKKLLSAPYFALFIAYTQKIANWFVFRKSKVVCQKIGSEITITLLQIQKK